MAIKIISLNTWYGGKLFEEMKLFLLHEQADILILQEAYHSSDKLLPPNYRTITELQNALNLTFYDFAPAFIHNLDTFSVPQGNAILSTFPLSHVKTVFYDVPFSDNYIEIPEKFPFIPRNLQICEALLPDGSKLILANTQGIWGLDGGDSDRRLAMARTILTELDGSQRVVLAGDFNLKPKTQTIELIEEKYTNIFRDELQTSFNMKRKDNPGYATAVVDMAFVTPDIVITEHCCPKVDISDHLPLVFSIELNV